MRTLFIVIAIAFQLAATSAIAQQNPILVKNVAETEIEVKNAQGVVEKKRVPLDKATPGTEVIYTTTFTNQGSETGRQHRDHQSGTCQHDLRRRQHVR